ncbi:hypothetical protein Hanom_Chr17g01554201 [Helianthus anomalus]
MGHHVTGSEDGPKGDEPRGWRMGRTEGTSQAIGGGVPGLAVPLPCPIPTGLTLEFLSHLSLPLSLSLPSHSLLWL